MSADHISKRWGGVSRLLGAATVAALVLAPGAAEAALYSFSTTEKTDGTGLNASLITTTSAAGVSGPSNIGIANGAVGLTRFWNSDPWFDDEVTAGDPGGFSLIGDGTTAIANYNTEYFSFTVTAETGKTLNLASLDFDSARGGTSGTRLFEIHATVDDDVFNSNTDLIFQVTSSGQAGVRSNPVSLSADLTAPKFQGITAVTFRYYPKTDDDGRSIGFTGMELNGAVVPEPAAVTLLGIGGVLMASRRRKA